MICLVYTSVYSYIMLYHILNFLMTSRGWLLNNSPLAARSWLSCVAALVFSQLVMCDIEANSPQFHGIGQEQVRLGFIRMLGNDGDPSGKPSDTTAAATILGGDHGSPCATIRCLKKGCVFSFLCTLA